MDQVMRKSTELDAIVPELWSAAYYPTLLEKFPFNSSIARDYDGEVQALGDTVNITTFPQFSAAVEMAEEDKVDADAITATNTQLVINKQVVKDFIVTERALRQGLNAGNALRDLALHAIMKRMQTIIVELIVPSASSPDHAIGYNSGTTLALVDILAAKSLLDLQDVEDIGRKMILDPTGWNDLFTITGFTSRDYIPAGSPMTQGAITTPVLGFDVDWTSELTNVCYFYHPIFMQMAVQDNPAVKVFDLGVEGKRTQRVNMTTLFGVKQLSNLRVVSMS